MPDRKTLEALLVRVEGAGGEDRKIDGEIAKAVGEMPANAQWMERNVYGEPAAQWYSGGYGHYIFHEPPEVTSSIDAALALVERLLPDVSFGLSRKTESHRATYWIAVINGVISEVEANSAPLAILAALLMALMQTQDENV